MDTNINKNAPKPACRKCFFAGMEFHPIGDNVEYCNSLLIREYSRSFVVN